MRYRSQVGIALSKSAVEQMEKLPVKSCRHGPEKFLPGLNFLSFHGKILAEKFNPEVENVFQNILG